MKMKQDQKSIDAIKAIAHFNNLRDLDVLEIKILKRFKCSKILNIQSILVC